LQLIPGRKGSLFAGAHGPALPGPARSVGGDDVVQLVALEIKDAARCLAKAHADHLVVAMDFFARRAGMALRHVVAGLKQCQLRRVGFVKLEGLDNVGVAAAWRKGDQHHAAQVQAVIEHHHADIVGVRRLDVPAHFGQRRRHPAGGHGHTRPVFVGGDELFHIGWLDGSGGGGSGNSGGRSRGGKREQADGSDPGKLARDVEESHGRFQVDAGGLPQLQPMLSSR